MRRPKLRIFVRAGNAHSLDFATAACGLLLVRVMFLGWTQVRRIDDLIDVEGRANVEVVSELLARRVPVAKHPGRGQKAILWHGTEVGSVRLSDRKISIRKPGLRQRRVPNPARKSRFRPTR